MILLIDSASEYRIVCLFQDDYLVDQILEQGNNDHSKFLLPQIDRLLTKHALTPTDLDGIIVGQGPGSYTGVRVAVTIAKSFSLQARIPLFAVDSLSLFASAVKGMVAVQIPMKRNIVLGAVYEVQEVVETLHPAGYYTTEEWQQRCGMSRLLEPSELTIQLKKLHLEWIEDVVRFGPNYAREWQSS
jgi:tRNA threonylcarbamoyl adenosine modification protein YeaZ